MIYQVLQQLYCISQSHIYDLYSADLPFASVKQLSFHVYCLLSQKEETMKKRLNQVAAASAQRILLPAALQTVPHGVTLLNIPEGSRISHEVGIIDHVMP